MPFERLVGPFQAVSAQPHRPARSRGGDPRRVRSHSPYQAREACVAEAAVKPGSRQRFPKMPDEFTAREGLNLAGSGDPGWTGAGDDAERLSLVQSQQGREKVLRSPSGRSGTAGRGPACPVVLEPGGAIPPATRFRRFFIPAFFRYRDTSPAMKNPTPQSPHRPTKSPAATAQRTASSPTVEDGRSSDCGRRRQASASASALKPAGANTSNVGREVCPAVSFRPFSAEQIYRLWSAFAVLHPATLAKLHKTHPECPPITSLHPLARQALRRSQARNTPKVSPRARLQRIAACGVIEADTSAKRDWWWREMVSSPNSLNNLN